jgi:hypothetical protein
LVRTADCRSFSAEAFMTEIVILSSSTVTLSC